VQRKIEGKIEIAILDNMYCFKNRTETGKAV